MLDFGPNSTPENGIYTGDALRLGEQVPAGAVALILTDPVYQNLAQYAWLGEMAMRILPPGAPILVWASGPKAPAVVKIMEAAGLRYVQPFYYTTMGKTHALAGYRTFSKTTPLLWLATPGRLRRPTWWIADTFQDNTPPEGAHPWNKNMAVTRYYLEPFAEAGDLVFDPFCGHGTVPCVGRQTGRRWLGFEIDPERAATARERIRATAYRPALLEPAPAQLCMELTG